MKQRLFFYLAAGLFAFSSATAGVLPSSYNSVDSGVASNVVIDFESHLASLLAATGAGINYTSDGGDSWLVFGRGAGLVSEDVSAMHSSGNRIWVATNHGEILTGRLRTISDGISFSEDEGNTWTRVDFSSSGQNIDFVWGGDRTIFDITGHRDDAQDEGWLFFTAFAGGLLGSSDGGDNWKRVFRQPSDSLQFTPTTAPDLSNRFFSCITDTSHADTLLLWAGTAGGLYQYAFAPKREKPFSKYISRIAFCDECTDSNFAFIGGENGITRRPKTGPPYISRFVEDGLPGPFVSALIDFRGRLLVGTLQEQGGVSTGLAYSDDRGDSFQPHATFNVQHAGPDRTISDFAVLDDRLYMAAQQAGVFVSADRGDTWQHIWVDSSDTLNGNPRNVAHAFDVYMDTLRIGTDSGLMTFQVDLGGALSLVRYDAFPENDSSSARIIRVKTHVLVDSTGNDSTTALWTVHRPLSQDGEPIVGYLADTATNWMAFQREAYTYDLNFVDNVTYVVGQEGIRYNDPMGLIGPRTHNPVYIDTVQEVDPFGEPRDNLLRNVVTTMQIIGDTIYFGTDNGFAVSLNGGDNWMVTRPVTGVLQPDFALGYVYWGLDSLPPGIEGIPGDWVIALETQNPPPGVGGGYARIWASVRPTYFGAPAIVRGRWVAVTNDDGDTLRYSVEMDSTYAEFAWNFAFNGDTVFAATNGALIFAAGGADPVAWDTIPLVDAAGEPLVLPGTEVYAVGVLGTDLWVGTGDRTVRIDLTSDQFSDKEVFWFQDSATPADEVYAFPVPFSPNLNQGVDFHFTVESGAHITLEVYDFAMNLVARVLDDDYFPAGVYPGAYGDKRATWDGRNGRGDRVAVGVYYFKVEYSTGDVRWGKLAIMP